MSSNASSKICAESEKRVAEEYLSSLSDLNCNSKPLINMLTMLAEENIDFAPVIVKVVEQHIAKVSPDYKLPILYLIDSIVKNVKSSYVQLFSQCIVSIFCNAFEKVNEKVRERMYALRQTWNEVFSPQKLYTLDCKVKLLDANWPITALPAKQQPSIHVNPNFLKSVGAAQAEEILQAKTRELLELKKRKLELELEATNKHLEQAVVNPLVPGIGPAAIVPPAIMPAPPHRMLNPASGVSIRPGMFANFRNPRPMVGSGGGGGPQMNVPMAMKGYGPMNNVGKAKINPVNPGLIHSVRQRDPRLARQTQTPPTQSLQQQPFQGSGRDSRRVLDNEDASTGNRKHSPSSSYRNSGSSRSSSHKSSRSGGSGSNSRGGSRSRSKSPSQRHSSSRSPSSRSSKSSSNSDKNKSRDKDRKDKDTSSSSIGSSGSSSYSERSKSRGSSSSRSDKPTPSTCDKDAFEIAPLSSTFKRKSSPVRSPGKLKEPKRSTSKSRSSKNRSRTRSRSRSRSPSPESDRTTSKDAGAKRGNNKLNITGSVSSDKDNACVKPSSGSTQNLDKNIKKVLDQPPPPPEPSPIMDVDLRQFPSAPFLLSAMSTAPTAAFETVRVPGPSDVGTDTKATAITNVLATTTSSPRVSFKIQKLFNKLEKSTENSLTASSTAASTSSASIMDSKKATATTATVTLTSSVKSTTSSSNHDDGGSLTKWKDEGSMMSVDGEEDSNKKRPSSSTKMGESDDEPVNKKSKSACINALFGDSDVDLRSVELLGSDRVDEKTPPPPPFLINDSEKRESLVDDRAQNAENWNNLKTTKTSSPSKKSSNFDDVRAKLAKAARLNKFDKPHKELSQRFKLSELHGNEESQEANDEKIRIIITQAQELLEAKTISQEQYKNLVKTVMSINETNKLNEAKRRESITASKQNQSKSGGDVDDGIDADRVAARDAVLKKRIPRLPKGQTGPRGSDTKNDGGQSEGGGGSPMYEDRPDGRPDSRSDGEINHTSSRTKSGREKHGKGKKWNDRLDSNFGGGGNPQKAWLLGSANKRGGGGGMTGPSGSSFRNSVPHPPIPPMPLGSNLRMPQMPWQMALPPPQFVPPLIHNNNVPPPPQPPPVLPSTVAAAGPLKVPTVPKACNSIDNPQVELRRTITIDGTAKEIRVYGEIAIIFVEPDQPREIGFQPGQRSIIIDDNEPIPLQFNDGYKPITIDGEIHKVRFGFPSRELYIDEQWYEVYFGGCAVSIPINNKTHILKAEGPPPNVHIGPLRRDLVVGKINMIVDALIIVPLFLDATKQTFTVANSDHTLQFADNLLTVLIDGEPLAVEYGGLPKSYTLGGKKYFIRFSTLPNGVVAGKVRIKGMIHVKTEPSTEVELEEPTIEENTRDTTKAIAEEKVTSGGSANGGVKDENVQKDALGSVRSVGLLTGPPAEPTMPILPPEALKNINIDDLLQKLVSSGVLGGTKSVNTPTPAPESVPANPDVKSPIAESQAAASTGGSVEEPPPEPLCPIDLTKPDSIKVRQAAIIDTLYSGMQCSSCGLRFPPEQTIKYSQHLDWHFRQNRRDRDSSRKAHSRKWYYDLADWVAYEEIEDLEEREKNFFESQQNDIEAIDDASNQRPSNSPIPSCPALPEDVDRACDMCHERFEQFYNEELEEWHLQHAVRVDDKIYHPLCYEDYKASLNPPKSIVADEAKKELINGSDDNAMDVVIKIEGDDGKTEGGPVDDDDDDVIVLPNEEPSVTEIDDDDDDEEYVPANVTREEMGLTNSEESKAKDHDKSDAANESDVEIQEPHIPFTDLDTYEEKELPEDGDENSQASLLNVKIKEEPQDEDDEDDGFEDVGTVVIDPEDEISIQSSEETQTQTIGSSRSAASPTIELSESVNSPLPLPPQTTAEASDAATVSSEPNISMDGNEELKDNQNLSTTGPPPAVPLASLVNKIKINMTKTNVTTNNSSNTSSGISQMNNPNATGSLNCISNDSNSQNSQALNSIPTTSSILVLCGGGGSPATSHNNAENINGSASSGNVSAISVIGANYGIKSRNQTITPAVSVRSARQQSPPPPPIEETITFDLKPALQKAALKKMKKIESGSETSGLCSIM